MSTSLLAIFTDQMLVNIFKPWAGAGIALEGVAIILAVDMILDMFLTTANVFSYSCGAVIISGFDNAG